MKLTDTIKEIDITNRRVKGKCKAKDIQNKAR